MYICIHMRVRVYIPFFFVSIINSILDAYFTYNKHLSRLLPCNNQYINFRSFYTIHSFFFFTEYRNHFEYSSRLNAFFISGHRPLISSLKKEEKDTPLFKTYRQTPKGFVKTKLDVLGRLTSSII